MPSALSATVLVIIAIVLTVAFFIEAISFLLIYTDIIRHQYLIFP